MSRVGDRTQEDGLEGSLLDKGDTSGNLETKESDLLAFCCGNPQ
jgi:hypothetical protein